MKVFRVLSVFACIFASGLLAQQAPNTAKAPTPTKTVAPPPPVPAPQGLNVDGVLTMVQAGLSEDVIIARLRKEGKAFDLSPDDLVRLKKANTTDNVLKVMIDPNAELKPSIPTLAAATVSKASSARIDEPPQETGIYVKTQSGWTQLQETDAQMKKKGLMGITWVYPGGTARIQVSDNTPEFFIRYSRDATIGKAGNNAKLLWETLAETHQRVFIVPVQTVGDSREEPLVNGNTYKMATTAVEAKQYSANLASIRPVRELSPNHEYAVYALGGSLAFEQVKRLDFRVSSDAAVLQRLVTVNIYRPKAQILKPSLFINGEEVLRFPGGRRCTLQIAPGENSFQLDKTSLAGTTLRIEAGRVYYLIVKSTFKGHTFTEVSDSEIARQGLSELPAVEQEFVKDKRKVQ